MRRQKQETNQIKKAGFGFAQRRHWIIWGSITIVCSVVMLCLTWLLQTRLYIHSILSWILVCAVTAVSTVTGLVLFDAENGVGASARKKDKTPKRKNFLQIIFTILFCASIIVPLIVWLVSSPVFQAASYYKKAEEMVTVVRDSDEVSAFPNLLGEHNDTSNIPLIGTPEAIKKAETEMGRFPALGSQFELLEEDMTSQNISGSLCYVIPLQPKSLFKWSSKEGNHGYFIIDRNNGETHFVESSLMTTTRAPFNDAAQRIILSYMKRQHIGGLITDISPEVDDDGNFHYIGTVYTMEQVDGFKTVTGVVELDAKTKQCVFYSLDEIPEYVDRVFPESFFEEYLYYYGNYKNGFCNSLVGQKEVQEQTRGMDVIYIDGICYYYTGWTSAGKGESSNGIMMMNSKNGKIEYHITYGISEEKAQGVSEGLVQEKGYTASYPLLMKVGGEETYFMLMRDNSNNLTGYAFVNYKDYTKAAVNSSLLEAQAAYVKTLASLTDSSALDESQIASVSGTITQIANEVVDGTTIYYFRIDEGKTIYQMHSELDTRIVFAKAGDKISIEYYHSGMDVETVISCKVEEK